MDYNIIRYYAFGFIVLILSGCSQKNINTAVEEKDFLYKSPDHYEIRVPREFSYNEFAPSREYYYFGYANGNKWNIRTIEFHPLSSSCTPSTIGASQTTPLNDGIMGRVDYFDGGTYIYKVGPAPLCSPPQDYENRKDMHPTAYAFCSQKEEKTVLICISQMTDNPKLAEEIFSTFRWVK